MKDAQAKAILDVFDTQLQNGKVVCFGRIYAKWFARVGETTCQGVSLQGALAQVAQVLACETQEPRGVVLPRDWIGTRNSQYPASPKGGRVCGSRKP